MPAAILSPRWLRFGTGFATGKVLHDVDFPELGVLVVEDGPGKFQEVVFPLKHLLGLLRGDVLSTTVGGKKVQVFLGDGAVIRVSDVGKRKEIFVHLSDEDVSSLKRYIEDGYRKSGRK